MAKYSTGSGGDSGDSATCELCGSASDRLTQANVAGANLAVCPDCAPHGDTRHKDRKSSSKSDPGGEDRGTDRKRRAAQNAAKANPIWDGDSSHWEQEGTNYDDDPLPYLVSGYGDVAEAARQDAGLQLEELAEDLGVEEADVLAVEQGRAARAGIGGGLIAALESRLDVELTE